MKNLKNKMLETMIDPAANSRSTSCLFGTVIKSEESQNICDIKVTTESGAMEILTKVPVALYNKNIIDWFPKKGEPVIINISKGNYVVTGPTANSNYYGIRSKLKTSEDVYTNSFGGFMGGLVY